MLEAAKPFDYMAEANATASNQYHGDKVPLGYFQGVLTNAVHAIKLLDGIKKTLFYGRALVGADGVTAVPVFPHAKDFCDTLPKRLGVDDVARAELIIHSIVGKATECGELLEMLQGVLFHDELFDDIHFIEEVGDGQWYDAIGLKAIDATINEAQRRNIAKLRKRFPDKFTEYDANNRDLFAERKALEAKKPTRRIENWIRVGNYLVGDITEGNITRKDIVTSTILHVDEVAGICETLNTLYILGTPYRAIPRFDAVDPAAVDNA
jgi:hypothetical protein